MIMRLRRRTYADVGSVRAFVDTKATPAKLPSVMATFRDLTAESLPGSVAKLDPRLPCLFAVRLPGSRRLVRGHEFETMAADTAKTETMKTSEVLLRNRRCSNQRTCRVASH